MRQKVSWLFKRKNLVVNREATRHHDTCDELFEMKRIRQSLMNMDYKPLKVIVLLSDFFWNLA